MVRNAYREKIKEPNAWEDLRRLSQEERFSITHVENQTKKVGKEKGKDPYQGEKWNRTPR